MRIEFKKSFDKSKTKLDKKIRLKFNQKLIIFMNNPFDETLRNHSLKGKYTGYRSIDITGDYRAIFREFPDGTYEFINFIDIGTHSYLYG